MSNSGTRVQLQLSNRYMERLGRIMRLTGSTKYAEAFRAALKVYEYLLDETRAGGEIQILRPDGAIKTVKMFFDEGDA